VRRHHASCLGVCIHAWSVVCFLPHPGALTLLPLLVFEMFVSFFLVSSYSFPFFPQSLCAWRTACLAEFMIACVRIHLPLKHMAPVTSLIHLPHILLLFVYLLGNGRNCFVLAGSGKAGNGVVLYVFMFLFRDRIYLTTVLIIYC